MRVRALALLGCAFAAPAWADDLKAQRDRLLASCEPFVSVQFEGCEVRDFARCPDGGVLSYTYKPGQSPVVGLRDAEGDSVLGYDIQTENGLLRIIENHDPFLMSELLATGEESFDQTVEMRLIFPATRVSRAQGYVRLDGGEVVVDGRRLLTASGGGSVTFGPGGPTLETVGDFFIDREWGLMLSGASEQTVMGATSSQGSAPADFNHPGEPGFLSHVPTIGCGDPISKRSPR